MANNNKDKGKSKMYEEDGTPASVPQPSSEHAVFHFRGQPTGVPHVPLIQSMQTESLNNRGPASAPQPSAEHTVFHFRGQTTGVPHASLFQSMQPLSLNNAVSASVPQPSAEHTVFQFRGKPHGVPHVPLFQSMQPESLNNTAAGSSRIPLSYTAPLNAPRPTDPIDEIIAPSGESLKLRLRGAVEKMAMEKAAKSLQEIEEQLQIETRKASFLEIKMNVFKESAETKANQLKSLEQKAKSLRNQIKAAKVSHDKAEEGDQEKYYVDLIKLSDLQLDCKKCVKKVATFMMLPCRHVSVCVQCDRITEVCPVCGQQKERSVKVYLPPC